MITHLKGGKQSKKDLGAKTVHRRFGGEGMEGIRASSWGRHG